jgi:hypothetical protein
MEYALVRWGWQRHPGSDLRLRGLHVPGALRRAAPAPGAIRCYEKAGFKSVGVMRRYERDMGSDGWHDALLMELLAGEEHQSAVARSSCRQGG